MKGRPDPHAYVPLQKSSLNKRKKAKFEGQFKSLVKATKRGAAKAGKSKGGSNKLATDSGTVCHTVLLATPSCCRVGWVAARAHHLP